jgi:hypothetical protein
VESSEGVADLEASIEPPRPAFVRRDLEEGDVAVHIVGLGSVWPEGETLGIVEIQARFAVEVAAKRDLPCLFFIPSDLEPNSPGDERLLAYLINEAPKLGSVEICQGMTLEEFSVEVEAKIQAIERRRPRNRATSSASS